MLYRGEFEGGCFCRAIRYRFVDVFDAGYLPLHHMPPDERSAGDRMGQHTARKFRAHTWRGAVRCQL